VPAELQSTSGWIAASFEGLLKEIRTLAKGSCLLRMAFPKRLFHWLLLSLSKINVIVSAW
jgi:hypothetical protein